MTPEVEQLLKRLQQNNRPPIEKVWRWLDLQPLTSQERTGVDLQIREAYDHLGARVSDSFGDMFRTLDVRGFIKDYVIHTQQMRAPTSYHFATALTLLGASLRRRVHIDHGYFKIWPAVQSILIGPPGIGKSTATEYGIMNLARRLKPPMFNLLADSGSGVGMFQDLKVICNGEGGNTGQGDTTAMLYLSEMARFMGGQDYNSDLVSTLTDLFDSKDWSRRSTRTYGAEELHDIAVSALFCTNEEWLAKGLDKEVFGGGFFSRVLVFYETEGREDADGIARPDAARGAAIMAQLGSLRHMLGVATLTHDADAYYANLTKRYRKTSPGDHRLHAVWLRMPPHVLRVAMLLAVSEGLVSQTSDSRPPPPIEIRHIRDAETIVKWTVSKLPMVYNLVGKTFWGQIQAEIYNIVEARGGWISHIELSAQMAYKISPRQLNEHLNALVENGILKNRKVKLLDGQHEEPGWQVVGKL